MSRSALFGKRRSPRRESADVGLDLADLPPALAAVPEGPFAAQELEARVARGGALTYGAFVVGKLVTLLSTILLTRLLVPHDFGVVGYALLVLGFLDVLKGVGLGSFVVYRQELSDQEAAEVFTVGLISAVVVVALVWFAAPAIAAFFHDGRITAVTRVLSFSFIFNAVAEVHNAQLQKKMQFGRRVIPALATNVTRAVVAVWLAWAGLGYWSLVWGQIAATIVDAACCWALYPWIPRVGMHLESVRRFLRYGLSIALLDVMALVALDLDEVVVGRRLGTAALGLYALAFSLPQMLTISLSGAVSEAVFPAFATVQHDLAALRDGYLKVVRATSMLLVPIGLGLIAVAPAFVHAFFTVRWWPITPVIESLSLYAMIYAIGWSATDVYRAIGRPDLQWKLDLAQIVVLVPVLIVGAHTNGIDGVAVARVIAVIPYAVARFWLILRTIDIKIPALWAALRTSLIAGLAMFVVARVVAPLVHHHEPIVVLACQVLAGVLVYGGIVMMLEPQFRRRRPAASS